MENHATKEKEHLKTHAVNALALILGVGRERLTHALNDAGMRTSEKMTVAKAFSALSAKFQKQEDLARRQKAEADTAEITAAEKLGTLMLKKDCALIWADATIEVRKEIQRLLPAKEVARVLVELSKIKLGDVK